MSESNTQTFEMFLEEQGISKDADCVLMLLRAWNAGVCSATKHLEKNPQLLPSTVRVKLMQVPRLNLILKGFNG